MTLNTLSSKSFRPITHFLYLYLYRRKWEKNQISLRPLRVNKMRSALTMGEAVAIQKECSAVSDAAPVLGGTAQVVYGNQNWLTGVTGTTPNMLDVRDWPLAAGRSFKEQDVRSAAKVCLLGETVVDNHVGSFLIR